MAQSAATAVARWKAAMASGQTRQNYVDGVNGYNGNPMALAATPEATQRYLDRIQQSVSSGRRNRALMAASPALWKQNAVGTGAGRLASGAQKAESKFAAFANEYQPVWAQMQQAAAAVGGTGLGAAQAKVAAALAVIMQHAGTA